MKARLSLAFTLALICAGPNAMAQATDVLRVSDGRRHGEVGDRPTLGLRGTADQRVLLG